MCNMQTCKPEVQIHKCCLRINKKKYADFHRWRFRTTSIFLKFEWNSFNVIFIDSFSFHRTRESANMQTWRLNSKILSKKAKNDTDIHGWRSRTTSIFLKFEWNSFNVIFIDSFSFHRTRESANMQTWRLNSKILSKKAKNDTDIHGWRSRTTSIFLKFELNGLNVMLNYFYEFHYTRKFINIQTWNLSLWILTSYLKIDFDLHY